MWRYMLCSDRGNVLHAIESWQLKSCENSSVHSNLLKQINISMPEHSELKL